MNVRKLLDEKKISKRHKHIRFVLSLIEKGLITEEQIVWQGCFRILNPNETHTSISFVEVGKTWHRIVYPFDRYGRTYNFESVQKNIDAIREVLCKNNLLNDKEK